MRRFAGVLVCAVLMLAACGDSDGGGAGEDTDDTSSGAEGGSETYTVKVDSKSEKYNIGTTAYFPNRLKVAAGSTINFESVFTGEPHTVTLGKLVDEGLANAKPTDTEEPAELQKLPLLLPEGPGDANQMAAHPCFLASGDPPADAACEKKEQPEFDGTQAVYSSGFLPDGATFTVKLADDIEPGTYNFFCLLHRGAMTGSLEVPKDAARADSPEDVEEQAARRLEKIELALKTDVEAADKGEITGLAPPAAGQVIAGGFSQGAPEALVTQFGPKEVSVKSGSAVTWIVAGPHTISFNAPEDVSSSAIIKGPDGAFHANEKAFVPSGGPGQPPPVEGAGDGPPPAPRITDGGRFDGTGFRSSGIFVSFPPALDGYKLTFTKAGTFPYKCIIHPEMEGTVKVT